MCRLGDRLGFEQVPLAQVRDYSDRQPCNLRHSPRSVGTCEYFDDVRQREPLVEPHIPRFTEFEWWRGKRVLKIGGRIHLRKIDVAPKRVRHECSLLRRMEESEPC